jgi:hypothetical protein
MHKFYAASLIAMLAAGPAFAQSTGAMGAPPMPPKPHVTHTGVTPIDHGPFTAEASKAYEGGGVILQGAPGGHAAGPDAAQHGAAVTRARTARFARLSDRSSRQPSPVCPAGGSARQPWRREPAG